MKNLDKELGTIAQLIDRTIPKGTVAAGYVKQWRAGELAHRSAASIIVSIKASADRHTGTSDLKEALAYQNLSGACGRVIVDAMEGIE